MNSVTPILRALADPTRLAMFERLGGGEMTVGELKAGFDVSQPAISQHLAALRGAGLVAERREGRQVFYSVRPMGLGPLVDWLDHYQRFWHERLARMHTLLQEMDDGDR